MAITLGEYRPDTIWFATVTGSYAGGQMIEIDIIPDWDETCIARWMSLSGTVKQDGDWRWDGEGEPCDWRGTSLKNLVGSHKEI